jgi:hypothetical protein
MSDADRRAAADDHGVNTELIVLVLLVVGMLALEFEARASAYRAERRLAPRPVPTRTHSE